MEGSVATSLMMHVVKVADKLVSFALPPRCPGCGVIEKNDDEFCTSCWQQLIFLTGPGCMTCNRPMHIGNLQCGPCMKELPKHDGVRAALAYGEVSSDIAIRMKHGRRTGLARVMGRLISNQLAGIENAIIAPVPLHRWRLWARGYNQSLHIARHLKLRNDNLLVSDLLTRTRNTPFLRGLSRTERAKAIKGAFRLNPLYDSIVKGRTICLVDDVYTTGATINGCATALKNAGCAKVIALCWARVLDDLDR
jgi:ComF family protein